MGSRYSYEGSTPLTDGKWHHVAATWDGTSDELTERELYLYVDGEIENPGDEDQDQVRLCNYYVTAMELPWDCYTAIELLYNYY